MNATPPMGFSLNRQLVIRNILALFSGSAAAQAITALILLLTARQIGPEQFGQYAAVTALVTFASAAFNLGLDLWLLYRGGREPERIGVFSGSILALKAILGGAWLLGIWALAGLIDAPSLPAELIRLGATLVWFGSLLTTVLTTFKAILQNTVNSALDVAAAIARLVGTLLLIASGSRLAANFMWMQTAIVIVGLLAALWVAASRLQLQPAWDTARDALRQSPPYLASDLLAQLFMRQDVLIVALLLGDYAAGIYSPAVGILNAAFLVPAAVHLVMLPVLSNLFGSHPRQAWATTRRSFVLLAVIGAALCAVLLFGAPVLTVLLGSRFAGSERILQILSPIIFFHSINYGAAAVLVAANLQARRVWVQGVAVTLNLILNLAIARRAGLPGVAGVFLLTEIILLAGYCGLAWQYARRADRTSLSVEAGP